MFRFFCQRVHIGNLRRVYLPDFFHDHLVFVSVRLDSPLHLDVVARAEVLSPLSHDVRPDFPVMEPVASLNTKSR